MVQESTKKNSNSLLSNPYIIKIHSNYMKGKEAYINKVLNILLIRSYKIRWVDSLCLFIPPFRKLILDQNKGNKMFELY